MTRIGAGMAKLALLLILVMLEDHGLKKGKKTIDPQLELASLPIAPFLISLSQPDLSHVP